MRRVPVLSIGVVLIIRCLPLLAEAGPPLLTDDPGTPERGHWEINTAFTYSETAHSRVVAPLMDVNYGVLEHLQFKFEIPWETTVASDSGNRRGGLGDSLIGFKYRFLDEEKHKVSMSFYPQLEFGLHSLSLSRERGRTTTTAILPFQVEKKFGPIRAGLDFGVELQNDDKPRNFAGLAIGHEFKERFELLAEIRQESGPNFRELNAIVNGGFRLKINKMISLLGSTGTAFKRANKDQPRLFSYFAVQFKF
jgi:hypothetical protein